MRMFTERKKEEVLGDLTSREKIREFQRKLYTKAKQEPGYRFYALYDKVWRMDILERAYQLAKANGGAAGVDKQTFEDVERIGPKAWLEELQEELKSEKYKPQAVRRVNIPKAGGGERPLGIPTVRDRVVQTAAKIVIEPIFEADFGGDMYGYRPKRSALDAVEAVTEALRSGYTEVVDADLSKYFDTIPHRELMKSIAKRIVDNRMLRLIKMWLKVPIQEEDGRMSGGKKMDRGTPQGGVISPILANVYFNRMLKYWETHDVGSKLRAKIVVYADDFVILSKQRGRQAMEFTQWMTQRLKLKLNEEKTVLRDSKKENFQFLGYQFGLHVFTKTGRRYMSASPSKASISKVKEKLRKVINPRSVAPIAEISKRANQVIQGWCNYFSYGSNYDAYRAIHNFTETRVRRLLCRRHKVTTAGFAKFPADKIYGEMQFVSPYKIRDLMKATVNV